MAMKTEISVRGREQRSTQHTEPLNLPHSGYCITLQRWDRTTMKSQGSQQCQRGPRVLRGGGLWCRTVSEPSVSIHCQPIRRRKRHSVGKIQLLQKVAGVGELAIIPWGRNWLIFCRSRISLDYTGNRSSHHLCIPHSLPPRNCWAPQGSSTS